LKEVQAESRFQFERHGYFVADKKDSLAGKPVFNRTVTLRDAWQK
jgi:glutaminyl-tRNA synthetase